MSKFKAAPGLDFAGKLVESVEVSSEPTDEPPPPYHLVTLTLRGPGGRIVHQNNWPEDTAAGVATAVRALKRNWTRRRD